MDLDVNAGTVTVRQAQVELDTGELVLGPPKSRAGLRTVAPDDHRNCGGIPATSPAPNPKR